MHTPAGGGGRDGAGSLPAHRERGTAALPTAGLSHTAPGFSATRWAARAAWRWLVWASGRRPHPSERLRVNCSDFTWEGAAGWAHLPSGELALGVSEDGRSEVAQN